MSAIKPYKNHIPSIGERVYIEDSARVIGDVVLGDDCSVWPMAVIRGDMHKIRIGYKTNIQDGCVLHITHASERTNPNGYPLIIGNQVTVGHGAILHGCTVHDLSLIGIQAVVLDGAVIEPYVMVGAKCLVPPGRVLESGFLYIGAPAVKKRPLTQAELEYFAYSAENYVQLKDNYL
jgi:carbonic anhydrase/acetyltransferase-like protein (isoleucine patch superfamily)